MQDVIPAGAAPTRTSTAPTTMRAVYLMLVPFPIACFVGALITDLAYWATAEMMWADFSAWLLFAGLVAGVFAAIAGLIEFFSNRLLRGLTPAWLHWVGNAAVLVLALFNSFVHSRDAWTSVVPTGLVLSVLTVLALLFTGWTGWTMVYRYRVGAVK